MDKIIIEDLKVFAHHGVFDFEKENGQNFYISTWLDINLQKASLSDDLSDTVSYADVVEKIKEYVSANTFDLIETLAEGISNLILDNFSPVKAATVEVKKPEAPIDADFKCVSVKIKRERHKAYIAYGSNLGDSESIIQDGKSMLSSSPYCNITKESSVYKTTAYGVTNQPDFINGVWEIETYLDPINLLDYLHKIEHACGRERKEHWGPRTLDLDIILYDNLTINTEYLTIPHQDMANRDFVMEPLNEIAGYLRHPITGKTISEMTLEIKETHVIK